YLFLFRDAQQFRRLRQICRTTPRQGCDSGVAGRAHDRHVPAPRHQRPGQSVLAPAPSNHEDSHAYGLNALKNRMLADATQQQLAAEPACRGAMPNPGPVMLEEDGISLYDTATVVVDVRSCYA